MSYLSWLLVWFEATSGLKINLNKSKIILVGSWKMWRLLQLSWDAILGFFPPLN